MVFAVTVFPLNTFAREKLPSAPQDLRYGVILYDYFLKDYLGALSELQVAEVRGGIEGHGRHPLVLEGAMSLAFGMDRSATQIFEQASVLEGSGEVRNTAWFYLARMRFRRGDWHGATASLNRIDGKMDRAMADEVNAMRVNLAIRTEQLALAESVLPQKGSTSGWKPYLYYNLGTAHIRSQQATRGIDYLDRLAQMNLHSEEHWSLQDKGLIAAGFSLMREGDYDAAVNRFARVRLDSPLSEQALLGYGWSAVELGNYGQALGPWQILARQSPLRPAVQEALLAVPYAYEKLGSLGSALQEFEAAEAVFSSEINRLERLKSSLQPGDLVAAVSIDEAGYGNGENLDPELLGLVELLSGERFSLYRNEIRDLHALNERLHYWDENVDIYASMLAQRKLRRAELLEAMQDEDYQSRLQQFVLQRDLLAKTLADADTPEGLWKIADEETLALWLRVERAEAALQRISAAGESTTEERELLDRYRGMVLWQASERMSDWHWQAVKRLSELDRALETARASMQRVSAVVADAPDIVPFEHRLVALEQRLQLQRVAVERSVVSTESALQAILVEELGQQQARLRHYQSQARLARARLFDRAQLEMPQ